MVDNGFSSAANILRVKEKTEREKDLGKKIQWVILKASNQWVSASQILLVRNSGTVLSIVEMRDCSVDDREARKWQEKKSSGSLMANMSLDCS